MAFFCLFVFFHLYHIFTHLQVLVPITEDVGVSYELHRFIIGQKGSGIRKMMEEYEVKFILLPSAGQLSLLQSIYLNMDVLGQYWANV